MYISLSFILLCQSIFLSFQMHRSKGLFVGNCKAILPTGLLSSSTSFQGHEMGLFRDGVSRFKVAKSKPLTKSLLKPAVCFVLFMKSFDKLHSFDPLG